MIEWYTAIRAAKLNRLAIAYPSAQVDEVESLSVFIWPVIRKKFSCDVVQYVWCSGWDVGPATERSQVRVKAALLHVQPWASCSHTCASVHQAV